MPGVCSNIKSLLVRTVFACPRTKRSAVQASATATCFGGELALHIHLAHIHFLIFIALTRRNISQTYVGDRNNLSYLILSSFQLTPLKIMPA